MRGIFDSLQGSWILERSLKSFSGDLLGSVTGVARFSPQTQDVYYYREEGEFTDSFQKRLKVHKEYLYCYQPNLDMIEKHFSEDGRDQGLFYQLKFEPFDLRKPSSTPEKIVVAHGEHLCARDLYKATHRYYYDSRNTMTKMDLEYAVSGPDKSYIAKTLFRR